MLLQSSSKLGPCLPPFLELASPWLCCIGAVDDYLLSGLTIDSTLLPTRRRIGLFSWLVLILGPPLAM